MKNCYQYIRSNGKLKGFDKKLFEDPKKTIKFSKKGRLRNFTKRANKLQSIQRKITERKSRKKNKLNETINDILFLICLRVYRRNDNPNFS